MIIAQHPLDRLDDPARRLVMEDAVADVQAAKAGGMRCIAVRFVGHHPPDRLRDAGADLVVGSLEEVSVQTVWQVLGQGQGPGTEPRP